MISGTAGSTSFFLKKSCLETKRFSRHAWRVNDVVRPVSGLAILSLNPSLQMKLTDYYAAGNTERTQEPGR
jgi:hypothetical protein